MRSKIVLGAEISASHIKLALVDLENNQLIQNSYVRKAVNSLGNKDDIINAWALAISNAFDAKSIRDRYISIAMPGPFDYKNGVSFMLGNKKYDSLYKLNIKQLLAGKLKTPQENIQFFTDSACFLNGEVMSSDIFREQAIIGLNIGTGLATAVYRNGSSADAQLWNSSFLNGIAEDYISTKWLLKRYVTLTDINILNVKGLAEIYSKSSVARRIFREFAGNLSLFLERFVLQENPQIIILGGEVSENYHCFASDLKKNLVQKNINVPIVIAKNNVYSGILGASACWKYENQYAYPHL